MNKISGDDGQRRFVVGQMVPDRLQLRSSRLHPAAHRHLPRPLPQQKSSKTSGQRFGRLVGNSGKDAIGEIMKNIFF